MTCINVFSNNPCQSVGLRFEEVVGLILIKSVFGRHETPVEVFSQ